MRVDPRSPSSSQLPWTNGALSRSACYGPRRRISPSVMLCSSPAAGPTLRPSSPTQPLLLLTLHSIVVSYKRQGKMPLPHSHLLQTLKQKEEDEFGAAGRL